MSVSHLAAVLEDITSVCICKSPPVDLDELDIMLIHIFLTDVVYSINISCMTCDENEILGPVFDQFSDKPVKPVFQDLSWHCECAWERSECGGFAGFNRRSNQRTGLFSHKFSNSFSCDQVTSHWELRSIDLTRASRDDDGWVLGKALHILLSTHFSDIICHKFSLLYKYICFHLQTGRLSMKLL